MLDCAIYVEVAELLHRVGDVHLRAIILTDADSTLAVETVGPEAVELNVALAHVGVNNQEPCTEDTLGKDVEHGVGDDLGVDADLASTVGNTPDTSSRLVYIG
jgi:hypothetical protein